MEVSSARVKKLCWHTTFGDIRVAEPQYRLASKRLRPFAQSAKVRHRGCSRPLERVVTDFGADQAFAQVMDKLVEQTGAYSYQQIADHFGIHFTTVGRIVRGVK